LRVRYLFVILGILLISGYLAIGQSVAIHNPNLNPVSPNPQYIHEINKTSYTAYFKVNHTDDYLVEFSSRGSTLKFKPTNMGLNGESQATPNFDSRTIAGEKASYKSIFGEGIDIEYETFEDKLKEEIIISDKDSLPTALSSNELTFDFVLEYSDNTIISIDEETEWDGEPVTTSEDIRFIRKREPHTLHLTNSFYRIRRPFATDGLGQEKNLTYTLYEKDNAVHLTLNVPYDWLKTVTYPVTIDPTIWQDGDDTYKWFNEDSCSTHSENCTDMLKDPSDYEVYIHYSCTTLTGTRKLLFEFDISDLQGYDGTLDSANLILTNGDCTNNDELVSGHEVKLYEIEDFSNPTCGDQADDQVVGSSLKTLMTPSTCPGDGDTSTDIKSILQTAVGNSETYLAFKIDVDPTYNDSTSPSKVIEFEFGDSKIEYLFTCTHTSDCITGEFCNMSGYCVETLSNNDECNGTEIDSNDDDACSSGNCLHDNFDGVGYFCGADYKCVHNGSSYNDDYYLCNGEPWYKECMITGSWDEQVDCSTGCVSGNGSGTGCVTKWWPEQVTDIYEEWRNGSDVSFSQVFKWSEFNLNNFKNLGVDYMWELRREPEDEDYWDYWRPKTPSLEDISTCYGYTRTNLPRPWSHDPSEEYNLISNCPWVTYFPSEDGIERGNEEFEVVSQAPHKLEANQNYYVTVIFKRKTQNATIDLTSKSEYCRHQDITGPLNYGCGKLLLDYKYNKSEMSNLTNVTT